MPNAPWGSRPIFITSTFRDMHAERDHLRTRVFPELEERLRQRRRYLEPIDLRWGVETVAIGQEQAKEQLVLKVCLSEIERSRPFLIALIGDRYGWVPPKERMDAAVQEAGFRTSVEGKSITALEIEFGVLDSPDQRRRSHFYFRAPLPYDQMDPQTAVQFSELHDLEHGGRDRAERLRALKQRIERQMPDRAHHYQAGWDPQRRSVTGLEAWGRQVLEDLWRDLEAEIPPVEQQAVRSWQDEEREALEAFVERQTRGFVGREDTTEKLRALALSPVQQGQAWAACVTGVPGSGKSALFAHLHRQLQEENVLLLAHAAGALEAYRASLAIRERLAAQDPTNAEWQRDLWVSCWRMADVSEKMRNPESRLWWGRAYQVLSGMKTKVLFVSPQDEGFLARLREKAREP